MYDKIACIKAVREKVNLSLKDAKDAVEAIETAINAEINRRVEIEMSKAASRESALEAFLQGGNIYTEYGYLYPPGPHSAFDSLEDMFTALLKAVKTGRITLGQGVATSSASAGKRYVHKLVYRKGQ